MLEQQIWTSLEWEAMVNMVTKAQWYETLLIQNIFQEDQAREAQLVSKAIKH